MDLVAESVIASQDVLGECTIWCERDNVLWWVDIRAPALKRFDPATGATRELQLSEVIGSFGLTRSGTRLIAGMKSGLYWLDPQSGSLALVAAPERGIPANRFNDGRCDRSGRYWAGTMKDGQREPAGSLYRLDSDLRCTRIRGDVYVPNSIAWSPDDRLMYFADTHRGLIWVYDFDAAEGAIANERVFADCAGRPGHPDGSCVDADGCLWNAEYAGGRVVRYTPDGRIDRAVEIPTSNPTCCCFGGKDLDTLFVSTARQRMTPEQLAREPLAGNVFACRPGVQGLPEARFAA
jgi:sugar lactone lactonase YvrE